MTEATATTTPPADDAKKKAPGWKEDPESYRMTLGEHLEELRRRLIFALVGFVVIFLGCLYFGTDVVSHFCGPLYRSLQKHNINPQIYTTQVGSAFMVYIQISLISAGALSAPWLVYQFWLFVAAGLYPHERKWVTRYLPLSVTLLVTGMAFVYFFVLPMSLDFFIGATNWFPMPQDATPIVATTQPLMHVTALAGDPASPSEQTLWFNTKENKLKYFVNGQKSVIQFLPSSLVAPHITLDDYISLVVMMLVVFGLAFQLPLVVMAIIRIGIVDTAALKKARKVVYFALLIVAASITPGDVITATLALMLPLILLYELGIFLGWRGKTLADAQAAAEAVAEKAKEEQK